MRIFFVWFECVCSYHLFLVSSASVSSLPFLSLIVPIFARNVPLISLPFLTRSLVFSILLFSFISLHWSLRKPFLPLLAILWKSVFKWVYLSFSPLPLAFLLLSVFTRPPQTTILPFCISFSCGWSWSLPPVHPASCTVSQTSVHSSSGTLSIRSNPLICHFHCIIIRDMI